MEMNVRALEDKTFHMMQAKPFNALPDILGMKIRNIGSEFRVRYDACLSGGEPKIFAVFFADDLAMIHDRIRFPHPPGIGLPGSDMFFMEGPDGLALYVDTDTQESLWISIMDEAYDAGLEVVQAKSDMSRICRLSTPFSGTRRDVDPPARPGYAQTGFGHVPIETGMDLIKRKARPEASPDDPSIPGF